MVVGEQDTTKTERSEQKLAIRKIIIHKDYEHNVRRFVPDIALIKLSDPIMWTKYAQPVCLPNKGGSARGIVHLAGWGFDQSIRRGGNPTEELHAAQLEVVQNRQCQEWFTSRRKKITLVSWVMCAGFEDGRKDGCQVT